MKRFALSVLLAAVACGGPSRSSKAPRGDDPAGPAFLARVPADTPYVIASLEPMPIAYLQRELFSNAEGYERVIARLSQLRDEPVYLQLTPEERLLFELMAELQGKISADGLASLGIDVNARFVIYGLGLLPVIRFELGDAGKFRAAVQRVLSRTRISLTTPEHEGRGYWSIPLDQTGEIIVAIVGDELVIALAPTAAVPTLLPMVVGDAKPAQSLADTQDLQNLVAQYGFSKFSVGYVDLIHLARTLVGDSNAVANDVTTAIEIPLGHPACKKELPDLVQGVPRVVFGAYDMTETAASGGAVVEMRRDIARAFEGMRAAVPGLSDAGVGTTARLSFGVGIDVGGLLAFSSQKLGGIARTRFQCPALARVGQLAQQIKQTIDGFAASPLGGMRGVNIIIEELTMTEAGLPSRIEAVAFLGTDDPAQIIALAGTQFGMAVPPVEPGAPPQRLPVPGFGKSMLGDVFIASSDVALGISAGTSSTGRLSELLAAVPVAHPPLMFSRLDPEFLGQLTALAGESDSAEIESFDPELAEAMRAVDRGEYDHMESMTMSAEITDRGIEARADIVYKQ